MTHTEFVDRFKANALTPEGHPTPAEQILDATTVIYDEMREQADVIAGQMGMSHNREVKQAVVQVMRQLIADFAVHNTAPEEVGRMFLADLDPEFFEDDNHGH